MLQSAGKRIRNFLWPGRKKSPASQFAEKADHGGASLALPDSATEQTGQDVQGKGRRKGGDGQGTGSSARRRRTQTQDTP